MPTGQPALPVTQEAFVILDPLPAHPCDHLLCGGIRHGEAEPSECTGPNAHETLRFEPWKFRPRFTVRGHFGARRRRLPAVAPCGVDFPFRRRMRFRPLRTIASRT